MFAVSLLDPSKSAVYLAYVVWENLNLESDGRRKILYVREKPFNADA